MSDTPKLHDIYDRRPDVPPPALQFNNMFDPNSPEAERYDEVEKVAASAIQMIMAGIEPQLDDGEIPEFIEVPYTRRPGTASGLLDPDRLVFGTQELDNATEAYFLQTANSHGVTQDLTVILNFASLPAFDPETTEDDEEHVVESIEVALRLNHEIIELFDTRDLEPEPERIEKFRHTLGSFRAMRADFEPAA